MRLKDFLHSALQSFTCWGDECLHAQSFKAMVAHAVVDAAVIAGVVLLVVIIWVKTGEPPP